MPAVVILVVIFGWVKLLKWYDARYDGLIVNTRDFQKSNYLLGNLLLLFGKVKDARAILCAEGNPLCTTSGRIMETKRKLRAIAGS